MIITWIIVFLLLPVTPGITYPADKAYLEALHNSTDDHGWAGQDWDFETERGYLTWSGITWGTINAYVQNIDLSERNLRGSIPDNFTSLSNLTSFNMTKNRLKYIPSLTSMTSLKSIDLTLNIIDNYTGGFPSSIEEVVMANNSLSNHNLDLLDNLVNSSTINLVDLSGNLLTGSIDNGILANNQIKILDLSSNKLSGTIPTETISQKTNPADWTNLSLSYNFFNGSYPSYLKSNDAVDLRCNMFNCEELSNTTGFGVGECYCKTKGYYAKIEDNNDIKCTVCPNGTMANKWVKISLTGMDTDYYCNGPTNCQQCFYPSNCISGECKTGSDGPTCEKCESGYRMIGGECEECHSAKIPFSAVVLLVIVAIIVGYGVFLTGLNIVSATMIKQLMSYLQIFHLTMDIKAPWPRYLSELGDIYKFSMLNTQAIQLECYTSLSTATLFYISWATAVGWPILTTIIVGIISKSLSTRIHSLDSAGGSEIQRLKSEELRKSQTGIRRVYVLFMIIAFVPITSLSIRTFACETWVGYDNTLAYNDGEDVVPNQFFYDQDMSCWNYTFQGINFLATIFVVTEAGILVFLFLILFRLWKFNEKDKHNEYFGALYESFKPRGLFCEPIIMFRKFILILTTQLMYLTPFFSGIINAVVSFGWLLAVIILRPYNLIEQLPGALLSNWCNLFEITATVMILIMHVLALLQGDPLDLWTSFDMDGMDYTLFTLHILLLLIWVFGFCYVLVKHTRTDLKERNSRRSRRNTIKLNTLQREQEAGKKLKDESMLVEDEEEEELEEGNPVVIVNDAQANSGRDSKGSYSVDPTITTHQ